MTGVDLGIRGLEWRATLGRGGSGTVYAAFDAEHGREVAVKVLDATTVDDALRRRFDRERRAMGSVGSHPNIVNILTSGFSEHGHPYLVMDRIKGGTLADALRHGPLDVDTVVEIGVQLGDALGAAHQAGIVHCDVKPENVMLGDDRVPLLTDFGIASVTTDRSMRMTVSATPSFAAPEILQGREPDARSDLYSLAATLFACLEGRAPYGDTSETMLGVLYQIINDPVPRAERADLPPAVAAALHRAMAKEPDDRHPDVAAFTTELSHARVSGRDSTARPTAQQTTQASAHTASGEATNPRRRTMIGAVAALALLIGLGVGAQSWLGGDDLVAVPDLADQPLTEAVAALADLGLATEPGPACASAVARSSDPAAGSLVGPNTNVVIDFDPCIVPNFVDLRLAEAIELVVSIDGLSIEWGDYCNDLVLGQEPPAGTAVAYDTTIAIELRPC